MPEIGDYQREFAARGEPENPSSVPIQTVVNFLAEFNTNAAIFNETLAPALGLFVLQANSNTLGLGQTALNLELLEHRVNGILYQLGLQNGADSQEINRAPGGGWR